MEKIKILELINKNITENYNIDSNKIVGIYPYGSILYGTANEKSDLDLVVIVDMSEEDYLQYESQEYDIHYMSINHYKKKLEEHDIMALECFYNNNPILKYSVDFELNKPQLRKKISAICNNSWAKAGKKLELVDEDDYIGLKSLFHSFRILSFGINLASKNEINYTKIGDIDALDFWNEILNYYAEGYRWEEFKLKYKQQHNNMATKFRELAPKE